MEITTIDEGYYLCGCGMFLLSKEEAKQHEDGKRHQISHWVSKLPSHI